MCSEDALKNTDSCYLLTTYSGHITKIQKTISFYYLSHTSLYNFQASLRLQKVFLRYCQEKRKEKNDFPSMQTRVY